MDTNSQADELTTAKFGHIM